MSDVTVVCPRCGTRQDCHPICVVCDLTLAAGIYRASRVLAHV